MKSSRPYLVRALYDWIVDNGCTPYVLIDAHIPGVEVPQQYVKDGQIAWKRPVFGLTCKQGSGVFPDQRLP